MIFILRLIVISMLMEIRGSLCWPGHDFDYDADTHADLNVYVNADADHYDYCVGFIILRF